ncbi:MAG TPA: flagellar biosynthesis protein FlhA [Phycisphaerae bacterium]|nr:flagellar biosynthesis protein FlhA [Phycisphaerae bacterium]
MAKSAAIWDGVARAIGRHRGLLLPIGAAALIFVVLVPLPAALIDILLAANIALAAIVLLTAIYVPSPLDFSVFPSVLLVATLFRLVLNVATTRLILTAGADGRTIEQAQAAAGQVIWAFSDFVTRGSLTVGVILFAILAVVQFVVITKGAARISEVAARFVLDAMPGKQMGIDADVSTGAIDEAEARRRRRRITREADLYGAMDGASRFLRGDAVAAVLITLLNILGGLYVGLVQYRWGLSQTASLFTRLTIGDGLVTQVPAFLISISAALLVTRSTARTNLGEEVVGQLTGRPVVLVITAAFLGMLAMTRLPKAPLLTLGIGCVGLAAVLGRRKADRGEAARDADADAEADERLGRQDDPQQHVEHLLTVDPMQVELGYGLVRLVEPGKGGDLLERIAALRRQIAAELGMVVPPIRIRDNLGLNARGYVIKVRGTKIASGGLYPNQLLAVAGGQTVGKLLGREAVEPARGLPAVWISPSQREAAEQMNYTIVEPAGVIAAHIAEVVRRHAHELLSRERVVQLLDNLRLVAGNLVGEAVEKIKVGRVQKVLQDLLRERVPIRDLEAILEALCDADETEDVELLAEHVRARLARTLSQQYADDSGRLWCVSLDASLEDTLRTHVGLAGRASAAAVPPELGRRVSQAVGEAAGRLQQQGRPAVVVCSPEIRPAVRQLVHPSLPRAAVLAYNEIDSVELQSTESVRIEP